MGLFRNTSGASQHFAKEKGRCHTKFVENFYERRHLPCHILAILMLQKQE